MNRLPTAMALVSLFVAGCSAAGISHAIVWSLTALRLINGSYLAYRHDSMVATTLAAAIVGGTMTIGALAFSFSTRNQGGTEWLASMQRAIMDIGQSRSLFVIALIQLIAIFSLEATEQHLQLGVWLGLAASLGAPIIWALVIQAFCASAVVFALFLIARLIVRVEACLCSLIAPNAFRRRSVNGYVALHRRDVEVVSRPGPLALRFANRPPPPIAA